MAKILVVDDSKFMRLTLKNFLEKNSNNSHQVIAEAENVRQAVEKFVQLKPDLVTMDIIMPEESGLEAVKKIIAIDPAAMIIMVSAMGQEKIVEEALSLGAQAFVTKPIKPDELLATIDNVLKKK
jgi:two-component system, chemotaxis family, chemotaxis protein CheY